MEDSMSDVVKLVSSYVTEDEGALQKIDAYLSELGWDSSLGPQTAGGRATRAVDHDVLAGEELESSLKLLESVLPTEGAYPGSIAQVRFWGSDTPAGAPLAWHGHDGDLVVCCFLQVPTDPEPLIFANGEYIVPQVGGVYTWPSPLQHSVPPGARRPERRRCAVWNLTFAVPEV